MDDADNLIVVIIRGTKAGNDVTEANAQLARHPAVGVWV
jgi:hypothetical protein